MADVPEPVDGNPPFADFEDAIKAIELEPLTIGRDWPGIITALASVVIAVLLAVKL